MVSLDVRSNIGEVLADFKGRYASKQLTFATAVALTKTGQDVRAAEQAEMPRVFDRPTPFTLRSLFLKSATRDQLEARVWFREDWAKADPHYLEWQVHGGQRSLKRFEKRLQSIGLLMPGWFIVPGEGAKLDAYGNLSTGQRNQILSWFGAQADRYANTTKRSRGRIVRRMGGAELFVVVPGRGRTRHFTPGIYQRRRVGSDSVVQPVLIFVRTTSYQKRFDFFGVAKRVSEQRFPTHFTAALEQARARATAR